MKLTTVGTGKAIHLYVESELSGQHFENSACVAAKSKYTQLDAFEGELNEVTCKRCQASVAFQEASQPAAEEPQVVVTRTGNETHSSSDKVTTSCGEKVKSVYGPVGTPIETQSILPNGKWSETYLVPASVSCIKCQQ